jgi:hypothetical protein
MRKTVTAASVLLAVMLEFPLIAQYPRGGGYPPGTGYPYPGRYPTGTGIPMPRRSKDKKTTEKSKQPPLHSLTGVLRQIDDASVTIVAPDTRTITAKRSDTMKVFKKGEEISAASLTNGGHVRIDATQDEEGIYHAVAIYVESEGTAPEKSASEAAPSTQKSDEGRPVRTEQPGPAERAADKEKADSAPAWERSAPTVEIKDVPDKPDPDKPQIRRGKPKPRKSAPEETASGEPSVPIPSAPRATGQPEPQAIASNRPRPPETDGPNPSGPREDPRIAKAREGVAAYTQSLPNYFCQEQIARFASTTQKVDWQPLDVVSSTVIFENGRDEYRNLTINGKPVNKRMEEIGGAWSTGEFGMMAADLFSPATAAEFTGARSSSMSGHDAVAYDFEVDQPHSHWHIQAPSQSILPAYRGRVWLKRDTAEVLRIEMQTYRMPKEFPLDKVESAVDYEYVRLGTQQFLLPVHAETLTCVRGTSNCSRNVIDFRNYRKYAGQSTITFDK